MPKAKAYVKPDPDIEIVALIQTIAQILDKTENEVRQLFDVNCQSERQRREENP